MRIFTALLLVGLLATSCLKSLNFELNDNPLDLDYEGGFVVVDEFISESTMGSNNWEECKLTLRYHIDPLAVHRLNRIDMSDYDVRVNIRYSRISADGSAVPTQILPRKKFQDYVLDSVYTITSTYRIYDPPEQFCPEIFLTYKCLSCPPDKPFTGQTATQLGDCVRCGG